MIYIIIENLPGINGKYPFFTPIAPYILYFKIKYIKLVK